MSSLVTRDLLSSAATEGRNRLPRLLAYQRVTLDGAQQGKPCSRTRKRIRQHSGDYRDRPVRGGGRSGQVPLDHEGRLPAYAVITPGKQHEIRWPVV